MANSMIGTSSARVVTRSTQPGISEVGRAFRMPEKMARPPAKAAAQISRTVLSAITAPRVPSGGTALRTFNIRTLP